MFCIIVIIFYMFEAHSIFCFHEGNLSFKTWMMYNHLWCCLFLLFVFMLMQSFLKFLILMGEFLDDLFEFLDFLLSLDWYTFCDLIWRRHCLYYDSIVFAFGAFTWSYYFTRPRNCLENSSQRVVLLISVSDLTGESVGANGLWKNLWLFYIL